MFKKITILAVTLTGLLAEKPYDIVNSAIDANPDINRQMKFYNGVLQDLQIAESDNLPTLDYRGEVGRGKYAKDDRDTASSNYWKNNLTLKQNLFRGYKTQSEIEQSEAKISEAAYTVLDRTNTVALDTMSAYITVLKENELTKLFEENVQNHKDILVKIQKRTDAGIGKISEVLQTQSRLDLAYSNLLVQQNNFEDTLTQYHSVVGRYFDKSEFIEPKLDYNMPANIDKAAYASLLNNPSIKALKSSIIAKKAEYKKAKSEFYPILDAIASTDWEDNADGFNGEEDTASIGLVARWNIYKGGAVEAGRLKALEGLSEARKNLRRIQRDVIKQSRLAYMAYQAYQPQIGYLIGYVNKSKLTLDAYIEEYGLGRRDLVAILDAQKEYNGAKRSLVAAQHDFLLSKYRVASSANELLYIVKSDMPSRLILTSIEDDLNSDKNFARNVLCDNPSSRNNLNKYDCEYTVASLGYEAKEEIIEEEVIKEEVIEEKAVEEDSYIEETPEEKAVEEDSYIEETPVPVKEEEPETESVRLRNINFMYNSNAISPYSMKNLEANAEKLKNIDFKSIELHSYTDDSGSVEGNLMHSEDRANVTKDILVELGIPADKIEIFAEGKTNFIADNSTEQGRLLNRRIEFKVIK